MAHLSANGSHLNAVTKDNATHLVVVTQPNAWKDRELIVSPSEKKYAWASAWGQENYNAEMGTANVYAETQSLVNAASAQLSGAAWRTGDKAIFALSTRSHSPHQGLTDVYNWVQYSEYSISAVALKFKLRNLPLSRMSSVSAYVRAWQPSIMFARPAPFTYLPVAYPPESNTYPRNTSQLAFCFATALPDHAGDIDNMSCQYSEINGHCNGSMYPPYDNRGWDNKQSIPDVALYDPFDNHSVTTNHNEAYLLTPVYNGTGSTPEKYWYDIPITGTLLDFLLAHTGDVWLCAKWRTGNLFCAETFTGNNGLATMAAAFLYIQRLELRFVLTGGAY